MRVVFISGARTLGLVSHSPVSANLRSWKALASGPARTYIDPQQRVVRWMIGLVNTSPAAPSYLSPIATPRSVFSPSSISSSTRCRRRLFSSSALSSPCVSSLGSVSPSVVSDSSDSSLLSAPVYTAPSPIYSFDSRSVVSASPHPLDAMDDIVDLVREKYCGAQLSSLFSSSVSQSAGSLTLYTNTSSSGRTYDSQEASHSSDLVPVSSPCIRFDFSPASPSRHSFSYASLDSLTPPPGSPFGSPTDNSLFRFLTFPTTPPPGPPIGSPVDDSLFGSLTAPATPSPLRPVSEVSESFMSSPSFNPSPPYAHYAARSVPVTISAVHDIPGSWPEDDTPDPSWSDILTPTTVISAVAAVALTVASFWW